MNPTLRMARLLTEFTDSFGGTDALISHNNKDAPGKHYLDQVQVAVWSADDECDVTSFQTIGMSENTLEGSGERVELHFACREDLSKPELAEVCAYLARLCEHPFANKEELDWWFTLENPGAIPLFPNCTEFLMLPAMTDNSFDVLDDPEGEVKILYAVPISEMEVRMLMDEGAEAWQKWLDDNSVDLLVDRELPEG